MELFSSVYGDALSGPGVTQGGGPVSGDTMVGASGSVGGNVALKANGQTPIALALLLVATVFMLHHYGRG